MNGNSFIEQFLAQQFGDNPQLQAMLSMMQQRQDDEAETIEVEPVNSVSVDELRPQLEKAQARVAKLKKAVANLQNHLERFDAFQDELAHALGACIHCWGEDPSCRTCRGRGKPGALEPDQASFERWVLPAVKRMRLSP